MADGLNELVRSNLEELEYFLSNPSGPFAEYDFRARPIALTLSPLMQRLLGNWFDDTAPPPHKAGVWADPAAQEQHMLLYVSKVDHDTKTITFDTTRPQCLPEPVLDGTKGLIVFDDNDPLNQAIRETMLNA